MTILHLWKEAYIGLGSNLDQPIKQILEAHAEITSLEEVKEIAFSPLYSTRPVGPQHQPDFINAVLRISTSLSAEALLNRLLAIEKMHGRIRLEHWGARTLDLDLLLYDGVIIKQHNLTVPHPELPNRAFVLYPLADIASEDLAIPGFGPLAELLSACPAEGIRRMRP